MNEYIDICNDQIRAKVHTLGAQLISISDAKSGRKYLWSGGETENNEWNFSAPVLFPICGMLKNNRYTYRGKEYALQNHGFARFKQFRIESEDENSCSLSLRDDKETMEVYPFQFKGTSKNSRRY